MGSKLKQNLSNLYYQRRNTLTATPNRVTVLVENGADVAVWERMLEASCLQKQFDVHPYQHGMNKTESKPLIISTITEKGGSRYIGCVDSDYDKFLEGKKYPKGLFYPAHYLFQTHGYSIESLFCFPATLRHVYTTATSFQSTFDFEKFFTLLSQTVYPLFMADLYLRSVDSKTVLNVDSWKYVFPGRKAIRQALEGKQGVDIIVATKSGVNKYLTKLRSASSYQTNDYDEFVNRFKRSFPYVDADNCTSFIYGHALFDFIVALLEELKSIDLADEKQMINGDMHMLPQVKNQKIKELENLQYDIPTLLKSNFGFMTLDCLIFQMIRADLQNL